MRNLVITQNITLDGAVEMLDDWFDPELQDEDLLEESHRQDSQADALLVGRQTFEDFRRIASRALVDFGSGVVYAL
jgi:hypothetical protein